MFQLQKTFTFEASHQLVHHDGKCANVHGHSYSVTIQLSGPSLQKAGPGTNMLTDFKNISDLVKPLLRKYLDHHHLNDTLGTDSPTAEFLAYWTFERLKDDIPLLDAVMVRETASSVAIYRRPRRTCACRDLLEKETLPEEEYSDPKSDDSDMLEMHER